MYIHPTDYCTTANRRPSSLIGKLDRCAVLNIGRMIHSYIQTYIYGHINHTHVSRQSECENLGANSAFAAFDIENGNGKTFVPIECFITATENKRYCQCISVYRSLFTLNMCPSD